MFRASQVVPLLDYSHMKTRLENVKATLIALTVIKSLQQMISFYFIEIFTSQIHLNHKQLSLIIDE